MNEPDVGYTDVLVDIKHLREPFLDDLWGALYNLVSDRGRKAVNEDQGEGLRAIHQTVANLVDMLAYEIVNECVRQIAAQVGGEVVEDDSFDELLGEA